LLGKGKNQNQAAPLYEMLPTPGDHHFVTCVTHPSDKNFTKKLATILLST